MARTEDPFENMLVVPGSSDSHFHAEVCREKGLDVAAIMRRLHSNGFEDLLDISISPDTLPQRRQLLAGFPFVYLAIGAHPSETDRVELEPLRATLLEQARTPNVLAVGEIGLDWYWDFGSRNEQRALFTRQMEIADELNLPVVIHNREAGLDVASILESNPPRAGGIMHCFSEGIEIARRILDLGLHIGFGGNLTYKKSDAIREAANYVPEDRILIETDAPFLAPQAVRGQLNHPGYLGHTAAFLARLRGISAQRLAHTTTANFRQVLNLYAAK